MGKTVYKKLVRDRVPEIIKADNATPVVRVLSDDEYSIALRKKLIEEANEIDASTGDISEYADLLSVFNAAIEAEGYNWDQVQRAESEKTARRGGFNDKIFLEEVIDKEQSL